MGVSSSLWPMIADALDSSAFLVLLASPTAARSAWVHREIEFWKARKPVDRILLVLTDGSLLWDPAGDFDRRSTAVPPALFGLFQHEPRFLDLRWARSQVQLDLRHSWFRDSITHLGAPLHGCAPEDLEGADIRLHRRALRLARTAAALLMALTLVAVISAALAISNAREADQRRQEAQSRALAAQAITMTATVPDLAQLLALESLRLDAAGDGWAAMEATLSRAVHPSRQLAGHEGSVTSVAVSDDGRLVATAADIRVRFWDPITGAVSGAPITELAPGRSPWSVRFAPGGELLATGHMDGAVQLWETASRRSVAVLQGHRDIVETLAFSPDGRLLASVDRAGTVRLWDVGARMVVATLDGTGFEDVQFGANSRVFATAGAGAVRFWSVAGGTAVGPPLVVDGGESIESMRIAFSPDGSTLATASSAEGLSLWDAVTHERRVTRAIQHTSAITRVAFSPDGLLVATGSNDKTARLWDAANGDAVGPPFLGHTAWVRDLAFAPDRAHLVTASGDDTARIWALAATTPLGEPALRHGVRIGDIAVDPGGTRLVTAGVDGHLRFWDLGSASLASDVVAHGAAVEDVDVSEDGTFVVSGGNDGIARIWTIDGQPRGDPIGGQVDAIYAVAIAPDDSWVATGDTDGTLRLWDAASGRPIVEPVSAHSEAIYDIAVSPDGRRIVSSSFDGTARVFDVAPGALAPGVVVRHEGVPLVEFDRTGGRILSAGNRGARQWDVATGAQVGPALAGPIFGLYDAHYSPDGRLVATAGSDGTAALWDAVTGRQSGTLMLGHGDYVGNLAFSPSDPLLVTVGSDGAARLWDIPTAREVGTPFTGHTGVVRKVVFTPDGGAFITAGADGNARVWPAPRTWVARTCETVGRNLSQDEWDRYVGEEPYVRHCAQYPSGPGADPDAAIPLIR
jgi:WD40 repeat protein